MKDFLLAVAPYNNAESSESFDTDFAGFFQKLAPHIAPTPRVVAQTTTQNGALLGLPQRIGPYQFNVGETIKPTRLQRSSPTRFAAKMAAAVTNRAEEAEISELAPYVLAALLNGGSIVAGQLRNGHAKQVKALFDDFGFDKFGLKSNLITDSEDPNDQPWDVLLRRFGLDLEAASSIVKRAGHRSGLRNFDHRAYDDIFRNLMASSQFEPGQLRSETPSAVPGPARNAVIGTRGPTSGPPRPPLGFPLPLTIPRPPESEGLGGKAPAFFFELEGEGSRGDEVIWGREFALVFNYGVLSEAGLAIVKGKDLDRIVQEKLDVALGVDIVPVGLTLIEGGAGAVAIFEKGVMTNDPPRFRLRAPEKKDAPPSRSGVSVVFTRKGAMIYNFFLEIKLVQALSGNRRATPVLDLDLQQIVTVDVERSRAALVYIVTQGDCWQIYGKIDEVDLGLKCTSKVFPASLERAYRETTLPALTKIADNAIWRNIDENLDGDEADREEALSSTKAAAAAGWKLYKILSKDAVFEKVLDMIEALPDGSLISIYSNETAFPWELLYPLTYVNGYPPQNYQPQRFWGQRFIIESLQTTETKSRKPPARRQQPGSLHITMACNKGIDSDPPWNQGDRPLLPVKLQKKYFDAELTAIGKYFDEYNAIWDTLRTPHPASLMYYFCHGSADQLKFDAENPVITPEFVTGDAYPGWPVVFLNACEAADISPLSFLSFRTEFLDKKAAGVIAPSFPIPTLFAAVFAKAFLAAYVKKAGRVGEILFRLRRELLAKNNPLGLWYSLQCPLDVKPPEG